MTLKLIVALDFSEKKNALDLVAKLDPRHCALKVGSQMFTLFGTDFVRSLIQLGFKVFLDLKFHDIPNTVAQACRACADLGVWMINVHASGGLAMMQAAKKALEPYKQHKPLLIAVTVLTSMSSDELPEIGLTTTLESQVSRLAQLAYQAGLDGVVCSAFEVAMIKENCSRNFLTITPGLRLPGDDNHDQSRIMTPSEALKLGSDFLVLGRSISQVPDPQKVLARLLQEMNN